MPSLRKRLGGLIAAVALASCAATDPFAGSTTRSGGATATTTSASVPGGGEVKGAAWRHTPASAQRLVERALVALPAGTTGVPRASQGRWSEMAQGASKRVPVVILLHGSGGANQPAIAEWQRWLANLGVASVVPDSFALPDRVTYRSPVAKEVYERVHALRASEIGLALDAVRGAAWADPDRMVVAGVSEGAVAVARFGGAAGVVGRMILAWSCEDNYFVQDDRTALAPHLPVLNVISASDPFFTATNPFLGRERPVGHCAPVFATHKRATIVLIPGAPHTVLNEPAARHAVEGFVHDVLRLDLH